MPSGAKKRKAAKRKKEQQQQQQSLLTRLPESPTLQASGLPHFSQGGEEDDRISQSNKRSDSGSESASPEAYDYEELRVENDGEDDKARDSSRSDIQNGVGGQSIEPSTPERTEATMKKTPEAQDPAKENFSTAIPITEHEPVNPEQLNSADAENTPGEEAKKLAKSDALPESSIKANAASDQPHDSLGGVRHDAKDQELSEKEQLKERATWVSCCGIFDLMIAAK